MTADRLPAILQAMQDAAHEAGDVVLASALALTTSPREVAPLLPLRGADEMQGVGLYALTGDGPNTSADFCASDRVLACRVAARLGETACLILAADRDGHTEAARRLWSAASALAGINTAAADLYPEAAHRTSAADLEDALASITEAANTAASRHGLPRDNAVSGTIKALSDALAEAYGLDLSGHLAAADKRARDASAECLRLHAELDKARKDAAGWHALVQEASQVLGNAGFHGDNIVKQARRATVRPAPPAAEVLPRVVEWTDLQPGDLALDVGAHDPDEDDFDWALTRTDKRGRNEWRSRSGESKECHQVLATRSWGPIANKAVLIARNVPKRANAIRAAYEAMRDRAMEVGKDIPRRST